MRGLGASENVFDDLQERLMPFEPWIRSLGALSCRSTSLSATTKPLKLVCEREGLIKLVVRMRKQLVPGGNSG